MVHIKVEYADRRAEKDCATIETKILKPKDQDILCGKDKLCGSHIGSRRFREIIDSYRTKYEEAKSKKDRMRLTKEIFWSVKKGSAGKVAPRFLKYNPEAGAWEEITSMAARDKISHALRFAVQQHERNRKKKEEMEKNKENNGGISVKAKGMRNSSEGKNQELNEAEATLWKSFVVRQAQLVASIKAGDVVPSDSKEDNEVCKDKNNALSSVSINNKDNLGGQQKPRCLDQKSRMLSDDGSQLEPLPLNRDLSWSLAGRLLESWSIDSWCC